MTASMREAWRQAFDDLGGVKALVRWGESNPDDFYKAITKLIPTDVTSNGNELKALTHAWKFGDREVTF